MIRGLFVTAIGACVFACSRGAPATKPSASVAQDEPSAPSIRPVPTADAPPVVSAAPLKRAVEKRAKVTWDARVVGAAGAPGKGGKACTLEATVASVDGGALHLASDLSVRCGAAAIYEPDGLNPGTISTVREVPGIQAGTYRYTIVYSSSGASIDTLHARALIGSSATGTRLVVANESRPMKDRLLSDTPESRVIQAGSRASADAEDELSGRVTSASGDTVVAPGSACRVGFHYYGTIDAVDRCDVLVLCDGSTLIGRPELFSTHCKRQGNRVVSAQDLKTQPADNDPAVDLDQRGARIWNDIDGSRWSVKIAFDARR